MKADLHVHTVHSGYSSLPLLQKVLRESYNQPDRVYELAKARGMDLVAITDHNEIAGALALGCREDVIVGCEVTAEFPDEPVAVHLNVFDINERQHFEIQRRRTDVRNLMPYLRREAIFTSLNHVASGINGPVTGSHIVSLLPWIDALEVRNGSRLSSQNRTAECLACAYNKVALGGSDAHTQGAIGRTWVEAPKATNREEFLLEMKAGRVRVGGGHGGYLRMASDIVRAASGFYGDRFRLLLEHPLDWKRQAFWWCGLTAMPVVLIPLVAVVGHFVTEKRFNQSLLFDLVAERTSRLREAA